MSCAGCGSRCPTCCRAPRSTSTRWRSSSARSWSAATPTGPRTARSSSASRSWPAYGTLARLDPTQQRVGERVEADEYSKDDVRDFALWKGATARRAELVDGHRRGAPRLAHRVLRDEHALPRPQLRHPHRRRRPHLSPPRGRDRPVRGRHGPAVRAHLAPLRPPPDGWREDGQADRQAAATVRDLRARAGRPRALRYALLAAHYRAPLEFTDESLAAATSAVERLSTVLGRLDGYRDERADDPEVAAVLVRARGTFEASMDDDLAIAPALGAVFELVRDLNRRIDDRSLSTGRRPARSGGAAGPGPRPGRHGARRGQPAARRRSTRGGGTPRGARRGARGEGLGPLGLASGRACEDWAWWSRTPGTGSDGSGWSRPMARPDEPHPRGWLARTRTGSTGAIGPAEPAGRVGRPGAGPDVTEPVAAGRPGGPGRSGRSVPGALCRSRPATVALARTAADPGP